MRIGPPQPGHGSRRVSGMISAVRLRLMSGPVGPEQGPDLRDVGLALRAGQQAVMPDAVKAVGQHVDQEPADELVGGQPHDLLPVAGLDAVVLPAEGDRLGIGADQAAVRDGDAMGVAAEIGQHRLGAAEGRLGVDHPFGLAERGEPGGEGAGVCQPGQVAEEGQRACSMQREQPLEEQTSEQPGQHPHGQEEPGRQATQRVPSGDRPPPGTIMWTWGWWVSAEPQVCSTLVMPIRAPRRLGSAAMVVTVSADARNSRS